jgi:hypothetical protein
MQVNCHGLVGGPSQGHGIALLHPERPSSADDLASAYFQGESLFLRTGSKRWENS